MKIGDQIKVRFLYGSCPYLSRRKVYTGVVKDWDNDDNQGLILITANDGGTAQITVGRSCCHIGYKKWEIVK